MADGTVELTTEGLGPKIDTTEITAGTSTVQRQRIHIGGTAYGSLVEPTTNVASTGDMGLRVRIVPPFGLGPSTEFIGALSSGAKPIGTVTLSSGSLSLGIVTLSSGLAGSTASIGALSSGSAFIGSVALTSGSSGTQLGTVSLSSGTVSLTSGSLSLGIVTLSSGLAGSTASIGALSSGGAFIGIVALSSGSSGTQMGTVSLSSGTVSLTSGSLFLGSVALTSGSSGNQLGTVSLSSGTVTLTSGSLSLGTVVLSSGTLTLGTLTTGTAVGLTTAATNVVALSTVNLGILVPASTVGAAAGAWAEVVGGIVSSTGTVTRQSSGNAQQLQVDPYGRPVMLLHTPLAAINTANLVTAANTSQQQLIAAPGANTMAHITVLEAWSTIAATSALNGTYVTLYSSSGQADPGRWKFPLFIGSTAGNNMSPSAIVFRDFDPPLTQPTANNGWFVVSSSSGIVVQIQVQYFLAST
jgi:hypothetical protein